jgi:hypothetical protein
MQIQEQRRRVAINQPTQHQSEHNGNQHHGGEPHGAPAQALDFLLMRGNRVVY